MKSETNRNIVLFLVAGLSFLAGSITTMKATTMNTEEPVVIQEEVLNVIQETETHYYSNGSTLIMTAIYHEDGSVDTHTEFSYPLGSFEDEYYYYEGDEYYGEEYELFGDEFPSSI